MLPYINIFSGTVPMYGITVAAGVLAALLYLKASEKEFPDIKPHNELLMLCGLLGAFIGAKLLYVIISLPEIISESKYLFSNTLQFLEKYFLGGFVFYGGLYGGILGIVIYSKRNRLSVSNTFRYAVPAFPLVHAFGRIGCFCMGCCYGKPSESAIAVTFMNSDIAPRGVPLVPVQLIEAVAELILFILLASIRKKLSGRKLLAVYLGIYSVLRFILEFWRGDGYRGFIAGLSVSQLISVITAALAVCLVIRVKKRAEEK